MKSKFNQELNVGDKIMCYHMEGETSVSPGTKGTVTKVGRDPFERDGKIIEVDWENGSKLALVSTVDVWKKIEDTPLNEDVESEFRFLSQNENLLKYFDWRFFRKFLYKLRNSGIVNMIGAAPLIYAGKEYIDRYYGEGKEDDEAFQSMLEDADEARHKMVQGVINYLEETNGNAYDIDLVNRFARKFSQKLLELYIRFSNYTDES